MDDCRAGEDTRDAAIFQSTKEAALPAGAEPLSSAESGVTASTTNHDSADVTDLVKLEGDVTETSSTLRPEPRPSAKRRESEVKADHHGIEEVPSSKKRKRAASPPWTFPTAEKSSIKSADGRRVSARHMRMSTPGNGLSSGSDLTPLASENEGAGQNGAFKGQGESLPSTRQGSKSRAPSPPWKKSVAEGPTTIIQNGVRKSARQNRELLDAPKRVSPRSKKIGDKLGHNINTGLDGANDTNSKSSKEKARASIAAEDMSKLSKIEQLKAQINALQPTRSFQDDIDPLQASPPREKRAYNRKSSFISPTDAPANSKKAARSSMAAPSPSTTQPLRPTPRIKLRLSSNRPPIQPPHPGAVFPPAAMPPLPSLYQVIERHELKEMQQPYTENERGPPGLDHFVLRSLRQAQDEGVLRHRILRAAEVGGPLSKEACSLYKDTEVLEPPRPYAHIDHLVGHVTWLRHLQRKEKEQHKQTAKKLAYEALEKYKEKVGPTEEDIEAERNRVYLAIYRQTVADIKARWELVQKHVESIRLQRWEASEEIKRQARLQEQLAWSEEQLKRQRGEVEDYSDLDDNDGDGSDGSDADRSDVTSATSGTGHGAGSDSEVMSDTSDENSSDEDEQGEALDQEALDAYRRLRDADAPDIATTDIDGDAEDDQDDDEESEDGVDLNTDISALLVEPRSSHRIDAQNTKRLNPSDSLLDIESPGRSPSQPAPNAIRDSEDTTMQDNSPPALPGDDDEENDLGLSDDESTDMDSEDYDSDEDMSESDEENQRSEDDSENSGSEVERGGLLALFSKKEKEALGLPTPVASAEDEEGGDANPVRERSSSVQANTAAVAELAPHQPPVQPEAAEGMDVDIEQVAKAPESPPLSVHDQEDLAETSRDMIPQPSLLRGTLRSYQHAGLDWLASLYRNGTNGILADEMGLGKTIQTIALLAHLAEVHEVWDTHLVIVPTSVILNWVTEFQKFLPGFRVLGYYGNAEERQRLRRGWVNDPHHEVKEKRGYNVVITSYQVAMSDINAIRNVQWHYLVLDEAHNIRNFMSQRWQVLIRLKTRARLMLTGTPLQNSLTELWSLLTFLTAGDDLSDEARHGSLEEFLSHWKEPVKEIFDRGVNTLSSEAQRVVEKLHISLRPFLLRRLKSEVEKDLPKKTESVVVCKLSKRQRQLYQDYMGLADTKAKLAQGNAVSAGKVLLSLRRVCNHPDLFDPRPIQTSYALEDSPVEPFTIRERLVRHLLCEKDDLPVGIRIVAREQYRKRDIKRERQLAATTLLQRQAKALEKECEQENIDYSSLFATRRSQRIQRRLQQLQDLKDSTQASAAAVEYMPVYGADLRHLVTIHKLKDDKNRAMLGKMTIRLMQPTEKHVSDRILAKSAALLQQNIPTLDNRAETMQETIARFAFVTPNAVAPVLKLVLPEKTQAVLRACQQYPADVDFAQEARVRTSIAFPDKRLLIYDSGKLQRLTFLLRELQAKGSRSLIFTQMTGTLNVLEQFLNLLGLPYLRLDGSTPVERRQLYSAEFNRPESKYQCMILSSRAGGVGLNLTGASSVIFFDLDWNPQMDRQCMDRAHRIGQVRDVEVFKMVSEKTVEENILRRANQKSLLDQTVIQEGHFTTEHSNQRPSMTAVDNDDDADMEAALERAIGGGEKTMMQTMESVEDKEDVQAAQQARKEEHQDDADFADRSSKGPSVPPTPGGERDLLEEDDERKGHVDVYMIKQMERLMAHVPFVPPRKEKRVDKHGRDPSHRPKKKRL